MDYLTPTNYREMKTYIENYHPEKLIPFELQVRSFLRIGETGITPQKGVTKHVLSDETCKVKGLPPGTIKSYDKKGVPTYPEQITVMRNGFAQITIIGKHKRKRTVPTPFTIEELDEYYETSANVAYHQMEYIWKKFGLKTHKGGRATGIVNYWLVNPIKGQTDFFEIKSYSGHKSIVEIEPYLEDLVYAKNICTDADLEFIRNEMMNHFPSIGG